MKVSVVIPVYNAEKYLAKAIDSAIDLIEVNEIVLVEDGSPDKSLKICIKYSEENSKVKLYRHPNGENRGAGISRNLGISKATEEYIAFLDADDFYLPNRFKKDKEVFANFKNADGVYNAIGVHYYSEYAKKQFCEIRNLDINKAEDFLTTVNSKLHPSSENCFEGLLGLKPGFGYFSIDGLTIKKSSLNKMNKLFWESSMHEDTDFIIRLSYYCNLYPGTLNKAVTKRGVHEENRITNNENINTSRTLYYKELYNWTKENVRKDRIQFHIFNRLKYFEYLVDKKSTKLLNVLFYTLKHPSIFFNDQAFSKFVYLTKNHRSIKQIIVGLKRRVVFLFFKKYYTKYKTVL